MTHMKRWNDPQHPRFKRITHSENSWITDQEMFLAVREQQYRMGVIGKDDLDASIVWAHDPKRWPLIFDAIIMGRQDWFHLELVLLAVDEFLEYRARGGQG